MRSSVFGAVLLLVTLPAWAQTVTVEQPWARATAPSAITGAAYATIIAGTTDRLTAASTPVASKVEVHETLHDNGIMRMREVEGGLALETGKPVRLVPGGYHLMLTGLNQPLRPGDTFTLTLNFAVEPPVTVTVPVRAVGAGAGSMDHMHMH